jgi:hypothetical protein
MINGHHPAEVKAALTGCAQLVSRRKTDGGFSAALI